MFPLAVAEGIRLVTLSVSDVIALHTVPFVLYSIKLDTPFTTSLFLSYTMLVGVADGSPGKVTTLACDLGTVAVAAVRT